MTDKATVEMPTPVAGKVIAINGKVGEKLAVGSELAVLETERGQPRRRRSRPSPRSCPAPAPAPPSAGEAPRPGAETEAPQAWNPLSNRRRGEVASPLLPAVRIRAPSRSPRPRCAGAPGTSASSCNSFPAAGRGAASPTKTSTPMLPEAAERPRPALLAWPSATGVEDIKVIGLRRKIAEKMQDAKRRIPHFAYVEEVDVTALEELRAHLNETRARTNAGQAHPAALPDARDRQRSR